jgi:hypothetical protein
VSCEHHKNAKSFEQVLESSTGHDYQIVKENTVTGNYVVYQNKTTGEYVAYNMDKFDRVNMTSLSMYNQVAIDGVDISHNLNRFDDSDSGYDSDGNRRTKRETFYYNNDFIFSAASTQSHDLETIAALEEAATESLIAYQLSNEYSFSLSRSQDLAKLALRYQKLESIRELTASEKDHFTLSALGISHSQIEKALKEKAQGKEDSYAKALEAAAQVNRTTPEQIGRFFENVLVEKIND